MDNLPVRLQPGELPVGYCFPGNPQQFYNDIIAITSGYVPGNYNFFNYGNTEPLPEDRNKPWVRLYPDGSPDRVYVYFGGNWVSRHNTPASSNSRIWWVGTESDAWAYDGGDGSNPSSTAPTDATGAMWEKDSAYDARFPVQVGTLASGAVLAVGDVGGEEKHLLTLSETPKHDHDFLVEGYAAHEAGTGSLTGGTNNTDPADGSFSGTTTEVGGGLSHNNMPPYRVGMWIRRTARLFLTPS